MPTRVRHLLGPPTSPIRLAAYPLGVAALWGVLALLDPTKTYHLAPVFLAAALPIAYRARTEGAVVSSTVLLLAAGGLALALAVTGLLAMSALLAGPSLLPRGGVVAESVLGAVAGGLLGAAIGLWPARGRQPSSAGKITP